MSTDPSSVRGDVDYVGAALALRTFVRWIWVPAAFAVLGFTIGSVLPTSSSVAPAAASTSLGLTSGAQYPFYDAILARQQGLIDDLDLLAASEQEVGEQALGLTVDSNADYSSSELTLTVEAATSDAARALVDDLAARLVQANQDWQLDRVRADAATLQQEYDAQTATIAEVRAQIEQLSAREAELAAQLAGGSGNSALAVEQKMVQTDLTLADTKIYYTQVLQGQLEGDLVRANLAVTGADGQVEIVQRSRLRPTESEFPLALVIAALGGLVGLALIPVLDHRFGRVRSSVQLAWLLPRARVIDVTTPGVIGGANALTAVALALPAAAERISVIVPNRKTRSGPLIAALESVGLTPTAVNPTEADAAERLVDGDARVLIVPRGIGTRSLAALLGQLEPLDAMPEVVLFTTPAGGRS